MRVGGMWGHGARACVFALGVLFFVGCGGSGGDSGTRDSPSQDQEPAPILPTDAGHDAGEDPDAGPDMPPDPHLPDGGTRSDAGTPDAGAPDAGTPGGQDAGTDGGTSTLDAGEPPPVGGPAERSPHWRASYYAGVSPGGMAVADFNGDGWQDVAVNAMGRGFMSEYKARPGYFMLLPNDGKGGLGKPVTRLPAGGSTGRIAAGHVDLDGVLDVMVGTRHGAYVWRGGQDGSFGGVHSQFAWGSVTSLGFWPGSEGSAPFSWAGGSFDDTRGPTVEAGFGFQSPNADGTLTYRDFELEDGTRVVNLLDWPVVAAVGDFNLDGVADVALSSTRWQLSLFFGSSSGRFTVQRLSTRTPMFLESADLNGDGLQDLVAASKNEVQVFWNQRYGYLSADHPWTFSDERPVTGLAVADVDGDGKQDLMALHRAQGLVSLWRGNIHWSPEVLATGREPAAATAADLDRDGLPELLVAEAGDNAISTYSLSKARVSEEPFFPQCPMALRDGESGGRAFDALASFDVGVATESVTVGDFDGNGRMDLALRRPDRGVRLVFSRGGGRFEERDALMDVVVDGFAAADFSEDGRADLAAFTRQVPWGNTWYSPVLRLLWSDGLGGFQASEDLAPLWEDGGHVVAADFDRDGRMDLGATLNSYCGPRGVRFMNQGGGLFQQQHLPDHNTEPDDPCGGSGPPVIADFNGDGTLDFVHATLGFNLNYTPKDGKELPGEGFENVFWNHLVRSAGDLDGDGAVDLLLSATLGEMTVLRGDGGGTLQAPLECRLKAAGPVPLVAVDVNGDGITDLLGRDKGGRAVAVALGEGQGRYHRVRRYTLESKPLWVGPADVTDSPGPELVVLLESGVLKVFPTPTP